MNPNAAGILTTILHEKIFQSSLNNAGKEIQFVTVKYILGHVIWKDYTEQSTVFIYPFVLCFAGYIWLFVHSELNNRISQCMWFCSTTYRLIPFFFAAEFVCCILVSVSNQTELPWEHIHPIPNKQILLTYFIIFGPSQKDPLVFHVKLWIKQAHSNKTTILRHRWI